MAYFGVHIVQQNGAQAVLSIDMIDHLSSAKKAGMTRKFNSHKYRRALVGNEPIGL